jgi:hypothetical protein
MFRDDKEMAIPIIHSGKLQMINSNINPFIAMNGHSNGMSERSKLGKQRFLIARMDWGMEKDFNVPNWKPAGIRDLVEPNVISERSSREEGHA